MASGRGKKVTADKAHPVDPVRKEVKPSFVWTEDSKCHYLLLDVPDFRKQEIKIQIDDLGQVNIRGERQVSVSDNKSIFFEQSHKVPDNSEIKKTSARLEDGLLTVTVPKEVMEAISEIKTRDKKAADDLSKRKRPEEENQNARNEHKKAATQEEKGQDHGCEIKIGDRKATDDLTKSPRPEEDNQNARKEHMKAADQEEKGQAHGHAHHHMPENKRRDQDFKREMFAGQILQRYGEERSMMSTAMQMVSKNKGIIITAVLAFSIGVLVARYAELGRHDEPLD